MQKYKLFFTFKFLSLSIFLTNSLLANENYLSNIDLIEEKKNQIKIQKEVAEQNKLNIEKSWLNNINLNSSYTTTNEIDKTLDLSVSLSQDLYIFGGIQNTYKYANKQYLFDKLSIDLLELNYIKKINQLSVDYMITKKKYEQALLKMDNFDIDLKIKKDLYEMGEIDISTLNIILIERQKTRTLLTTLKNQLETIKETSKSILNKSIEEININDFELINKKDFLEKNVDFLLSNKKVEISELEKKLEESLYLPKININGVYGIKDQELKQNIQTYNNDEYYSYGLKISMPLDIKMNGILENKRLQVLLNKNNLNDLKIELESYYNQKMTKINECVEQIDISLKNIELYKELVELTKEQFNVSFKTELDLKSIQNTYKIEEIEKEIWQLQIIREKMDLFFDTTILFDKK